MGRRMILPEARDPRLVTIRRGGTLTDADHRLLALWAADCAEHVLPLFDAARPGDDRPRRAIAAVRAWTQGKLRMMEARAAAPEEGRAAAGRRENEWQRARLAPEIRQLVLEDQRRRNALCRGVFDP